MATAAMAKAAQDAVDAAEIARAQECGKVADNCRLRVADKKQALADQAELLARKAIADEVRALEAEIEDLKIAAAQARPHPGQRRSGLP